MKKLNNVVYQKLILQAKEANYQKLNKLADGIVDALTTSEQFDVESYSISDLNNDVYKDLWKVATNILKYHNLESVDAEKIHETLEIFASKLINEIEHSLSIPEGTVGPLEPKLPGESK